MAGISTPVSLGLPPHTDEQQALRANKQLVRIGQRLRGRNVRMDRTIVGMQAVEWVGFFAGILAGGGILYGIAKKGGKWAVVKTIAVAGAVGAGEQAAEKGLRAAGAGEETIRGVRLAAAVVSYILLRTRLRGGATPAEKGRTAPELPSSTSKTDAVTKGNAPTLEARPGSIKDNPANRLIETGVPRRNGGWVRRWVRMTETDYRRWVQERHEFYVHVDDLADRMRLSPMEARRFRFEQMRRWRTEWLRSFLENRDY